MARDGSPNVVDCHELFDLFRNRYKVSRSVRGSPTGATSATHYLSQQRFDLVETTIPALQDALEDHIINVQKLVRMCHDWITAYDGIDTAAHLNSYMQSTRTHSIKPTTAMTIAIGRMG
jgi:hypothetical protein